MVKNESKPSIQCDKCRKWIKHNYHFGYSHRCSGRAEEVRRAAHRRFYSINRIQHFGVRSYEMARLGKAMYSVSTMYDPEVNKLLRKEIEMKKTITDLPTPEEVTRITATLDLASKLDNAAIAKLSSSKDKSSTPKIGELCGMDLLIDLSNAPDEAKYELYFKARTILEEIIPKTIADKD